MVGRQRGHDATGASLTAAVGERKKKGSFQIMSRSQTFVNSYLIDRKQERWSAPIPPGLYCNFVVSTTWGYIIQCGLIHGSGW